MRHTAYTYSILIASIKELRHLRDLDSGEKLDPRDKIRATGGRVGLGVPKVRCTSSLSWLLSCSVRSSTDLYEVNPQHFSKGESYSQRNLSTPVLSVIYRTSSKLHLFERRDQTIYTYLKEWKNINTI